MFWMGFVVGCGAGMLVTTLVFLFYLIKMIGRESKTAAKIERYWEVSIERMGEYRDSMAEISKAIREK